MIETSITHCTIDRKDFYLNTSVAYRGGSSQFVGVLVFTRYQIGLVSVFSVGIVPPFVIKRGPSPPF